MTRGFPLALALAAALYALAGCAGNGPPPADTSSSFASIQQTIFDVGCLNSGCHNGTDRAGNLVLDAASSYTNLVNAVPFNTVATAAGMRRVLPGDPDRSFLMIKLSGPAPGEGSPMPLSMAPLALADIERIRAWIAAGAPPSNFTAPPTGTATATPPGTLPPTTTATATATASLTFTPIPTPTFNIDATFARIQETVFTATCLDLGCHNAQDQAGGQVLESGMSYANLVGMAPVNLVAAQRGFVRVDPGKPDNSFLLTKLQLSTASDPDFGSRMPMGKPALDAAQIELIRAWILRGALPNE